MAGGGFQYFFIGPDGNTVSGPTIPSFAELAEMHPSGEWVSLLDAVNPLSGKQVYVDYILTTRRSGSSPTTRTKEWM